MTMYKLDLYIIHIWEPISTAGQHSPIYPKILARQVRQWWLRRILHESLTQTRLVAVGWSCCVLLGQINTIAWRSHNISPVSGPWNRCPCRSPSGWVTYRRPAWGLGRSEPIFCLKQRVPPMHVRKERDTLLGKASHHCCFLRLQNIVILWSSHVTHILHHHWNSAAGPFIEKSKGTWMHWFFEQPVPRCNVLAAKKAKSYWQGTPKISCDPPW